ncbi:cytochrome c biogenesis protein ResB [bacterium]|nr:cytochrome c biogenesis protein ResB [candidate division CSSED10-310 bacterium]
MMPLLSSVTLTLLVLSSILLMSIWGTLAPERNVYYSPAYIGALIVLAINLLACTLRRLRRFPHRFQRMDWGYYATHIGIMTILAGALVSLLTGIRVTAWIAAGETISQIRDMHDRVIDPGFECTLQRFILELHGSGMPDDFISYVSVAVPGNPPFDTRITVNHPLSVNGYRLYQSSYRLAEHQSVTLGVHDFGLSEHREVELVTGRDPIVLDRGDGDLLEIQAVRYEPDFVMMGPGRFGSRSLNPRNPAVLIRWRKGTADPEMKWVFLHHATMHRDTDTPLLDFSLDHVDQEYDSGLEYVRDPGRSWVTAGACLLILGLFIYLLPIGGAGVKR